MNDDVEERHCLTSNRKESSVKDDEVRKTSQDQELIHLLIVLHAPHAELHHSILSGLK